LAARWEQRALPTIGLGDASTNLWRRARARSRWLAFEFPHHFHQHVRDGDMLRATFHALAAFLAVGGSLVLFEDVEVEETGRRAIPVNREVVQLQEVGRNADP